MVCMGVAGVVSEVLPLQRSYWVPLTVAIILKPDVRRYLEEALGGGSGGDGPGGGSAPPAQSRMRRSTYRALADLRAEFQRTMSEPPSISRRATAWVARCDRLGAGHGRDHVDRGGRQPRRGRAW